MISRCARKREPGYPEVINLQPDRSGKAKAYQVRQMLKIYDDLRGET